MLETLDTLSRWLEAHRPHTARSLRPGLDHDQLAAVGDALGFPLSAPLRSLWRWHDGQDLTPEGGTLVYNLTLLPTAEVVRAVRLQRELFPKDTEWWGTRWVPLLTNGAGDYLCLDLAAEAPIARRAVPPRRGQVVQFWHDSGERAVLAPDLETFLRALLDAWQRCAWRAGNTGYQPASEAAWSQHLAVLAEHMPGYPVRYQVTEPHYRRGRR